MFVSKKYADAEPLATAIASGVTNATSGCASARLTVPVLLFTICAATSDRPDTTPCGPPGNRPPGPPSRGFRTPLAAPTSVALNWLTGWVCTTKYMRTAGPTTATPTAPAPGDVNGR